MPTLQPSKFVHHIELPAMRGGFGRFARAAESSLECLLGLDQLNALYDDCARGAPDYKLFLRRCLDWINVRWQPDAHELARIPRTGPLVVIANHPFGAVEGVILGAILSQVRDDVKVMANFLLGRIAELRDLFIFVDPFERDGAAAANVAPLRQSIRHLRCGGVLAVFPAGEVASVDLHQRRVVDPAWNTTVARLIQHTAAPVLPVFFEGRNSVLFQTLGLVHPRLRTAMLAREFFNRRRTRITARIGSVIPHRRLEQYTDDDELTQYLRQRTYLLQHRASAAAQQLAPPPPRHANIIAPVNARLLAAEVAALPPGQTLLESEESVVAYGRAAQIPHLLREIGRLREITFRDTGEGSGNDCDLDRFDAHYVQLFVWNRIKQEIVGAYRLGPTDEILATLGKSGLYTSTLFDCKSALLRQISPALELGRSFVRQEYQRSFSPLLLLWKGIGAYIVRNPRYRYLFGPVSISNTYQSISKQLMVRFLKENHCPPELVELAEARNPFRLSRIAGWEHSAFKLIRDSDDVSELVSDVEPQPRGIPVLLKQYLKMGAKLLAFNVDPAFADCVDGLMVCDLSRTDARLLDRYLTKPGRERFMQYHANVCRQRVSR
jgi:putative hemolysin